MLILNIILGVLATAVLIAAGAAVALTWHPEASESGPGGDTPLFHVLLGLGWGFGLVPFMAFTLVLFGRWPLVPAVTLSVAALTAAGFGSWWWFRQNRTIPIQLKQGWGQLRWVLLAALGVALVYLFKYDRSVFFLESCIHRVVMQTLQLTDNPIDVLASNADDQRLGNTSVISSFVVLYRGLGFRLLYAFVGFITALGGFALGRRVLGSNAWGWFVLFALPLNPYVAKIPLLDENLLTLGYASLFLPLMLRDRVPWAHVGALFGLAVMMRHVGILCAPAVVWAVWRWQGGDRRRAFISGFLAFNLVTLVGHIHHYVALGSLAKFESFGQIPEFPHRFLGDYSGLLQFPFAESVIRTPWNPLPTFLMWPTYLADHLGLVLFAAMLIGVVWMVRHQRTEGVFWLLWIGLAYAALSLQENWDVPNKMGIIYILFHPFILWAGAGLKAAAASPRTWGTALCVTALASGFGIHALRHVSVPADARYYEAWTGEREEDPAYVQAELVRVTDVAPWPDFGQMGPASRVLHASKFSGLFGDLQDPVIDRIGTPYGWFPGERVDPTVPAVVIEIELEGRLFDRKTPFIVRSDREPDVDLTLDGPPVVIPNLRVPWTPRPVSLLLSRGRSPITGCSLIFEAWGDDDDRREYLHERYHRGLMMVLGWGENDLLDARTVRISGTRVVLKVPAGPFSLVESVNNAGQNYLFWRDHLAHDRDVTLEGPLRVFHN